MSKARHIKKEQIHRGRPKPQFNTMDEGSSVRQLVPSLATPSSAEPWAEQQLRKNKRSGPSVQRHYSKRRSEGLTDYLVFGMVLVISMLFLIASLFNQSQLIVQERALEEIRSQSIKIEKDIDRMHQILAQQYDYQRLQEIVDQEGLEIEPSRIKVVEE